MKHGELGLPNVESDLDVVWASQVYKFLTSKDQKVMMMCARRLRDTVAASRAVKMPVLRLFWIFRTPGRTRESIARAMMSGRCLAWCEAASTVWEHCYATWRGMRLTSDCRLEIS